MANTLRTFFKRSVVQEAIADRCTGGFWTLPAFIYLTISAH